MDSEVMGGPDPDEQAADVLEGGEEPDGGEGDIMGDPQPDEQGTDLMGGSQS
jgi:hypothetical protein